MFIGLSYEERTYSRLSKTGMEHIYTRKSTIVTFRCDNCSVVFTRPRGKMDPKRLSNNYFHVCPNCDNKRFAQKKRVERKRIWDIDSSSLEDISKI
ncbi:hypothetical protein EB118_13935 [bacterium]|nr:hypothetical protein [bacterium]